MPIVGIIAIILVIVFIVGGIIGIVVGRINCDAQQESTGLIFFAFGIVALFCLTPLLLLITR